MEAVCAVLVWGVARMVGVRPRPAVLALTLATAAPAIAAAVWGTAFAVDPGAVPEDRPDWIVKMLSYLFYASIPLSLAAPLLAKGFRASAAFFALPQIPLTWCVGFLGVMQVTGVWL